MYGVIDIIWEQFETELSSVANNLYLPRDTPTDKLIIIYIAVKCGSIQIDAENATHVDKMMENLISHGYIEGAVTSALDDPKFLETMF